LSAYTNQGPPTRPSLWMPLPLPASPYKGEETEWRPHKSLKSRILQDGKNMCGYPNPPLHSVMICPKNLERH